MATPEATVYRGMEGTGSAQIFGREGDPFRAIQQRIGQERQNQAFAYEQARLKRQQRDKQVNDLLNYNPEKTFEPFNQQVLTEAEKVRKFIVDYTQKGDPNNPQFLAEVKKKWGQVEDLAHRGNFIKDVITETRQLIQKNPYLNFDEYYSPKINSMYMDDQGNGIPIKDVDINAIRNVHVNDPMGFNKDKYAKDFMKDVEKNVFNYVKERALKNGQTNTDDISVKIKGDLLIPDPNDPQGIKRNPDGTPQVNVTNDFANAYLDGSTGQRYYERIAAEEGISVNDAIRRDVGAYATAEKETQIRSNSNPQYLYEEMIRAANNGLLPSEVPIYTDRHRKIVDTINAIGEGGTVTPEAKAAIGSMVGSKFGDDFITGVQIVPGTNSPGTMSVMGKTLQKSAQPQLVLKIKPSDRLPERLVPLNLADPGAYDVINGIIEKSPAEGGKKIASDDLLRFNRVDRKSVYKGREVATETNQAVKLTENEQVSKWQKGTGLDNIKTFNGQKVLAANYKLTDPGVLGFGKKYEIELQLEDEVKEDGNKKTTSPVFKTIRTDNYEDLAKLYKENIGDDMVAIISPTGQKGKIPKSKLEAALKKGYTLPE